MYNLQIYPINVRNGQIDRQLPGLILLQPPKKAARGRETDQVVLLVGLTAEDVLTADAFTEWLKKKGETYYQTSGSVTSAMRSLAEAINSDLLDRNLKKAANGQVNGAMCLAVLRKDVLYTLVIGPAKLFIIQDENTTLLVDTDNHPRGLGVNQALNFRFSQTVLRVKTHLLLATKPSTAWTVDSLSGSTQISIDAIGRRLFNQMPAEMCGVLVRFSEGKGLVESFGFPMQERVMDSTSVVQPSEKTDDQKPAEEANLPVELPERPEPSAVDNPDPSREGQGSQSGFSLQEELPRRATSSRGGQTSRNKSNEEIKVKVGRVAQGLTRFNSKSSIWFRNLILKDQPAQSGDSMELPRSVLITIAILVPLLVVAFASSVYLKKGKTLQFDQNFQQGIAYAQKAEESKEDPAARMANLQQSLYFLEKAALYGTSADALALHEQVQKQLDTIQGIVRVKMVPIADQLDLGAVNISQMAATNSDLYLLDNLSGRVLRFSLTGKGYQQDTNFDCGPNPQNPTNAIGKIVDILAISFPNKQKATLLAIDGRGKIEYCIPSEPGVVGKLPEPDAGWKDLKSISLDQGTLHVLDSGRNAVYRYLGDGLVFADPPKLFFDEDIPDLSNAIDIEVNGDELYILRSSGELVECTYSHIKDYKLTECLDPAPYTDNRSGEQPQVVSFPGTQFIQMQMTEAPDSSLYLLDTAGRQLYHFSLKRNLQKVMTPGFEVPALIDQQVLTAEAISPGKVLFLAYENLVFMGTLP